MIKKLLCVIFIFFLTGCYNYQEINGLAIITAIGIDKKGDKYHVSYQVINPKSNSSSTDSNQTDFIVIESEEEELFKTARNAIKLSSRRLYGNHTTVMVISERLAKDEMNKIFDYIFRDPDIRTGFYVLIAKENDNYDFNDLLKVVTPLTNNSAKSIEDSLVNTNKFIGNSSLVNFNELIDMYINPNLEMIIPSIEVTGKEKNTDKSETNKNVETTSQYNGLKLLTSGIFKGNEFLGYLTKDENLAYNFVNDNIDNALISYNCSDDGYFVSEILRSSSKVEIDEKKKKIKISVDGFSELSEYTCDKDLNDDKVMKDINNKLNKKIEKLIKDNILSVIKNYNTDIYGFRDMIYKKNPKYYKEIKKNYYKDYFPNLDIEVKSDVRIFKKGYITGGLYENMEN